jgi:N-acyl-L-homoserine lactone synthetase
MFAARKRVFVDLLGWDIPVQGPYEIDQFDDAEAAYVSLARPGHAHRGSARLLRTDRPHILADLFSSLCAGPVPRGPLIREITRFCIEPDQPRAEQRETRNELVSALARYAIDSGVARYTAVAVSSWFRQISRFGWECRALGAPQEITIREDTIDALRRSCIYREPAFQLLSFDGAMIA